MPDSNPCDDSCQLHFGSSCFAARSGVARFCQLVAAEMTGNPAGTTYKSYIEEATAQKEQRPTADRDDSVVDSTLLERTAKPRIRLGLSQRPDPNCLPCCEKHNSHDDIHKLRYDHLNYPVVHQQNASGERGRSPERFQR